LEHVDCKDNRELASVPPQLGLIDSLIIFDMRGTALPAGNALLALRAAAQAQAGRRTKVARHA
jgi:hypothetical protein